MFGVVAFQDRLLRILVYVITTKKKRYPRRNPATSARSDLSAAPLAAIVITDLSRPPLSAITDFSKALVAVPSLRSLTHP